jgi:GMP synthase (glutamine-hydrolysing)
MPRILIVDCWDAASQQRVIALGTRTNAQLFEDALHLHDPSVCCVTLNVADGESLPAGVALGDFDGVMLTGSPLSVCDETPAVRYQIDLARAAFACGMPAWGSCYGLQLATVALGGVVRRNPNGRELGVARAITMTEPGGDHPLLCGRPSVFDALCSHEDEVETLPPGATVLAGNDVSAVQAMAVRMPAGGEFFGTQYHPELDLAVVAAILQLRAPGLAAEGFAPTEAEVYCLADDYRALSAAPERQDLASRYGIGPEILDARQRSIEIGNWLQSAVRTGRRPCGTT